MPSLPSHPLAHHRERIGRHRSVGSQVIGLVHEHRVDGRVVAELHQVDDARGLHRDLGEILFVHDDVAALLELVPLDDLGVRDFPLALRAPLLLLDAGLALGMQLVERQRRGRLGRREDPDGNVDQADLQVALPRGPCGHGCSSLSRQNAGKAGKSTISDGTSPRASSLQPHGVQPPPGAWSLRAGARRLRAEG